jgi:hypothetical protein
MKLPEDIIENEYKEREGEGEAIADAIYGYGLHIQTKEHQLWFCNQILAVAAGLVAGVVPDGYEEIGRRFVEHLRHNKECDELDDKEMWEGKGVEP